MFFKKMIVLHMLLIHYYLLRTCIWCCFEQFVKILVGSDFQIKSHNSYHLSRQNSSIYKQIGAIESLELELSEKARDFLIIHSFKRVAHYSESSNCCFRLSMKASILIMQAGSTSSRLLPSISLNTFTKAFGGNW